MTQLMEGKICLVTGATRGLGLHAAIQLAQLGAKVVIAGRSPERLRSAAEAIQAANPKQTVEVLQGELTAQADIRRIAAEYSATHPTLDVLLNNVGASTMKFERSPDGFEMTWALNYLNHFLLTNLLMPNIRRAAEQTGDARVVEVTSSVFRFARSQFEKQQGEKAYNGLIAYAQSKRAMNVFVNELTRRLAGTGVTANAITPGIVATNIASDNAAIYRLMLRLLNLFSVPVEKGVKPIIHLCAAPEMRTVSGAYYTKFTRRELPADVTSPEIGRQLWQQSVETTGLREE